MIALFGLIAFLLGVAVIGIVDKIRIEQLERSFVQVGDLWESIGSRPQSRGLYEVVRPNVNTEAGADSWVMRNRLTGRTLYMHHRQRVAGEWTLCMRDGRPMRRVCDIKRANELAAAYDKESSAGLDSAGRTGR